MLRLDYPDLDGEGRAKIWESMFDIAGLHLISQGFEQLGKIELNGRQIRNYTRLIRIVYPNRDVTFEQVTRLLKYGSADQVVID